MINKDARNDMRLVALRSALLAALGMAALGSVNPGPLGAQVARAPAAAARSQPRFTRIFGSDSMEISSPILSPDGRWVVFLRQQGSDTSNLWVVPASGGAPSQLTFGRYRDSDPRWFPSGDRIAFRSDRPSPSGEVHYYIMTIPFDARTGRSAGPAQQVSLEFAYDPAVSPDGRWVAFFAVGEVLGTGKTGVHANGERSSAQCHRILKRRIVTDYGNVGGQCAEALAGDFQCCHRRFADDDGSLAGNTADRGGQRGRNAQRRAVAAGQLGSGRYGI